jgi:hypothetical protein
MKPTLELFSLKSAAALIKMTLAHQVRVRTVQRESEMQNDQYWAVAVEMVRIRASQDQAQALNFPKYSTTQSLSRILNPSNINI